jgi:spore maturation protein CgeB
VLSTGPDRAAAIGHAALNRVRAQHTYDRRAKEAHRLLGAVHVHAEEAAQ